MGANRTLARGDLRVVNGDSLVLVLDIHEEDGYKWAEVMPIHDQLDMATAVDLVVSTESPSLTIFEGSELLDHLVVQTDLLSTCDLEHIGALVGEFGDHECDCLNELWSSKERKPTITSVYHYTGEPFSNKGLEEAKKDPRWSFKVDQGKHTQERQSKSLTILFEMMDNGELQNLIL